ncbi:MAG TPA: CDP-diacylglycerol--glycerol-3-phosphate 3-phosphatidyltransferase [Archangium sp.]|jgi:CDP-diacylglycerol--glycerol-3-phosphate 3-phosphatidyltransferase
MATDRETKRLQRQEARQKKREEKQRRKDEKLARREAKKAARRNRPPSVLLQEFWNLPNMLTLGRIFVIPVFVWLLYDGDPWYSVIAASVFTIAAVTDVVDGFLARRLNLITVTGKLLDPMADKLIVMAALIMMVRLGRVPAWIVIVLLSREFMVNGLRQVAASEGIVIAAGQEGKWKTALQLSGIVALCIHYTHPVFLFVDTFDVNFNVVGKVCVYLSTAFSAWSAAVYFRGFLSGLGQRGLSPEKTA